MQLGPGWVDGAWADGSWDADAWNVTDQAAWAPNAWVDAAWVDGAWYEPAAVGVPSTRLPLPVSNDIGALSITGSGTEIGAYGFYTAPTGVPTQDLVEAIVGDLVVDLAEI